MVARILNVCSPERLRLTLLAPRLDFLPHFLMAHGAALVNIIEPSLDHPGEGQLL